MGDTEFADRLNQRFAELVGDSPSLSSLFGGGSFATIPNARNKRSYRYFEHKQHMYCYTPWKDTDGKYWAWTYKPYGKGSQSGEAKKWRAVQKVSFSKRKLAHKRAEARYIKSTSE